MSCETLAPVPNVTWVLEGSCGCELIGTKPAASSAKLGTRERLSLRNSQGFLLRLGQTQPGRLSRRVPTATPCGHDKQQQALNVDMMLNHFGL